MKQMAVRSRRGRITKTVALGVGVALLATVVLWRGLVADTPTPTSTGTAQQSPPPAAAPDVPPAALIPSTDQRDAAPAQVVPSQGSTSAPAALPTELSPRPRLAERLPRWLRVTMETGLWSSPAEGSEFTRIQPGVTLRTLEQQGTRYRVHYPGDEERRRPGEAWVNAADVVEAPWPKFVRTRSEATLRLQASETAEQVLRIPARSYVEVLETTGRDWARVFLPARPDTGAPLEAWLDGEDAVASPRDARDFTDFILTKANVPASSDVWLPVPYRSQLDGSDYEVANCGPTVLWMALQSLGRSVPAVGQLRAQTLHLQDIDECDDCGVFIEHLAAVAQSLGAETIGPFERPPDVFHRWTAEEMRGQLRQGRVVVPQVMYRLLSGREKSDYWGDHYIALTGFVGDRFIYHDPIDTGGPGSSRTISAEQLMRAMEASDYPFAAYAVGVRN